MSFKLEDLSPKNCSFILRSLAAITASAVATLTVYAALSAEATAVAAPLLLATAATTSMGALAVAAASILPVAAVLLCVGAACMLPFCFGGSRTHSHHTQNSYGFFPAETHHHHTHSHPTVHYTHHGHH